MTHTIKRYVFIFRPWKGSQGRNIILPIYTSTHAAWESERASASASESESESESEGEAMCPNS